jgi:hypothetical protein
MSGLLALLSALDAQVGQSSSSHQEGSGGSGINEGAIDQRAPLIPEPLTLRSDSIALKSLLREFHVVPAVITAIPDMFGVGMFVSLSRDDINELDENIGVRMLLRTAQTLVNKELERLQLLPQPVQPIPPNSGQKQVGAGPIVPILQPVLPVPEPLAAARDNVDPYLVSRSVDTPTGRQNMYDLYGQHEGGWLPL